MTGSPEPDPEVKETLKEIARKTIPAVKKAAEIAKRGLAAGEKVTLCSLLGRARERVLKDAVEVAHELSFEEFEEVATTARLIKDLREKLCS